MANPIKYTTATQSNSIKAGNFAVGVNKGGYGPTNVTYFYNGKTPNVGGYTVYVANGTASPSPFVASNDSALITLSNQLGGSGITTIEAALNFFNASSTILCTNMDYPNIVTSGLILNLDAAYTPSFPKNGTTWTDLSGFNNPGTLVNGPSYSSIGGGSIGFDGSNDYVSILNNTTVSFTIGCWINTTATSYTGTQGYEGNGIVWSDVSGVANDFVLSILNNKASWFTGDNTTTINSTTTINTGSWFYITVVKNGTNSTKQLFINGTLESTGTSGTSLLTANPNIRIGGNTLDGKYFNGKISQVKIYNKVLSSTEILQNYYAGLQRFIPTDSLVLSLDGSNTDKQVASASTAYDMSGNNNNGTLVNGVALVSDGQRSFSYDGSNDYMSIPNSSSLQLSTQIAISVWFKLLDTTPSGNTPTIILKEVYNSAVSNQGFLFRVQMSNNSMYLALLNNGVYSVGSGANQIYTNIWYNAVGTYDGTQIKFYLNGVLKNTTNYSGGFLTNTQPLFIGQASTLYYMWGNIGQVQIYSRGLTASEVSTIYNATKSRYGL